MHARVVVYKFRPGTADYAARMAEEGLLPIFRKHAGYHSYEVIKTGPDNAVSVSTWESEGQAQAAVKVGEEWVKANIGKDVVSADTHVGTVVFSHR